MARDQGNKEKGKKGGEQDREGSMLKTHFIHMKMSS